MKVLRLIAAVLVVFAGSAGALALTLPSAGLRAMVTARVAAALGTAINQQVTIGKMEGDWPNHVVLSNVALADGAGPWLTVDQLTLRWHAFALVRGQVDVDEAQAGAVHVYRQPMPTGATASVPTLGGIREALEKARVGALTIQTLQFDAPVFGRPGTVGVTGALKTESGVNTLTLALARKDAPGSAAFTLKLPAGAFTLESRAAIAGVALESMVSADQATGALTGKIHLACGENAPCLTAPAGKLGAVTVDATMAGTLSAPQATAQFHLADMGDSTRTLKAFTGTVVVAPGAGGEITARGDGTMAGLKAALPEVADALADDGAWSLNGDVTGQRFTVRSAALRSGDTELTVAGVVDGRALSGVNGTLTLRRVGRLLGMADTASTARFELAFDRLAFSPLLASGRLAGVIDNAPAGMSVSPAATGTLRFNSSALFDSRHLALTAIKGTFGKTSFSGASSWARGARGLDHGSTTLTADVTAGAVPGISSPIHLDGRLTGGLGALSADVTAVTDGIAIAGAPVRQAKAAVTAQRTQGLWQGDLRVDGQWRDLPLAFTTAFTQDDPSKFTLAAVHAEALAATLDGALRLDTDSGIVTGALAGKAADMNPLMAMIGAPAKGAGEVAAAFTANGGQKLTLNLSANRLSGPTFSAESFTTQAIIADAWRKPKLTLQVKATDGVVLGRPLAQATITADGSFSNLTVDVQAKGAGVRKFSLDAGGTVAVAGDLVIAINRLALEDGAIAAKLLGPTRLAYSNAAISLAPTRVAVNGGTAAGQFTLDRAANRIAGDAAVSEVVLDEQTDLPGATRTTIDATIKVSGAANAADADLSLAAHYSAKESGGVNILAKIGAAIRSGRAVITGTASGLSDQDAKLSADMPARLDLTAPRIAFDMNAPMSGSLAWRGEVKPLWDILALDQHLLAGQGDVNLSTTGTLEQPMIKGGFKLTKGRYENLAAGTALQNLDADITAGAGASMAIKMSATDTGSGRATAQGTMTWDGGWVVDATGDLAAFHILRRDDVTAAVTGNVTYKGPATAGTLSGRLQVVRSEMRIGASYVPEIPLLRAKTLGQPVVPGRPSTVQLDVTLAIDDVLRIEGKGLEAYWRGDLRARGSLDAPDVSGTLTLARGTFTFLGRSFDLDTGSVTFTGGGKIDPELALSASRESGDVTATVAITGRTSQPSIALSSVPALPQDEVLAQLLFRKGATQLGPLESLQLASAAADLAGLSQGGLSGMLRRTFGLDIVGFGGKSGDAVVLGHQFSSALYVGVEQSVGTTNQHQIVVEWRLNRSLAVQSTTTPQTGADLGLIWRKNY